MSSPYHKEEPSTPEPVDDLMRDDDSGSGENTVALHHQFAILLRGFPNRLAQLDVTSVGRSKKLFQRKMIMWWL
jgi:hypothetical protein